MGINWMRLKVCISVMVSVFPIRQFSLQPKTMSIFLLAMVLGGALAAPQGGPDKDAVIVKYDSDNIGVDGYNWAYETSNGISAQEQGQLTNVGSENESNAVRGQFSYRGADGVTYTVTYIADENGFQPQGAHLPQAP